MVIARGEGDRCGWCLGKKDVGPCVELFDVILCSGCRFKVRELDNFLDYAGFDISMRPVAEVNSEDPPTPLNGSQPSTDKQKPPEKEKVTS